VRVSKHPRNRSADNVDGNLPNFCRVFAISRVLKIIRKHLEFPTEESYHHVSRNKSKD
jgi:hypothetical protein